MYLVTLVTLITLGKNISEINVSLFVCLNNIQRFNYSWPQNHRYSSCMGCTNIADAHDCNSEENLSLRLELKWMFSQRKTTVFDLR